MLGLCECSGQSAGDAGEVTGEDDDVIDDDDDDDNNFPAQVCSQEPTPRRSLPGRYSALVARERLGSECLSETSSVLTTRWG